MVKKIENKNLVIFDSINEYCSIKYKSLEEYINELFNNKKEDNLENLFFECVTKYIYIKDNHLIHFSNPISTKHACIPSITFLTTPLYIFDTFLEFLLSSINNSINLSSSNIAVF